MMLAVFMQLRLNLNATQNEFMSAVDAFILVGATTKKRVKQSFA
jgi:hypothetical protein